MPPRYVTFPELSGIGVNFSRKQIVRLTRKKLFPVARELSPNKIAWRVDEIEQWLATRPVRAAHESGRTD